MIDPLTVAIIGYFIIGFGIMFMVKDSDTKWSEVISIPIDWPIRVTLYILFCIGAIVISIYTEIRDFIKHKI